MRYVSPFKLYFAISAIYFLAFSIVHYDVDVMHAISRAVEIAHPAHLNHQSNSTSISISMARAIESRMAGGMDRMASHMDHMAEPLHEMMHNQHHEPPIGAASHLPDRAALHAKAVDNSTHWFVMHQTFITFLLVPLAALLLKLLYWRSGRYYIEHLVFAIHVQSFLFAMLLIALLPFARGLTYLLAPAVSAIYLFVAMKNVYRQKAPARILCCALMLGGYAVTMLAIALGSFIYFYGSM